jgi:hypothetical protein
MSEIRLTDQQHQTLSNLLNNLAKDAALRARLETDPHAVFAEHGLGSLLAKGATIEGLQATVTESRVSSAGASGHVDIHVDQPHIDFPHLDSHGDYTTPEVKIGPSIKIKLSPKRSS